MAGHNVLRAQQFYAPRAVLVDWVRAELKSWLCGMRYCIGLVLQRWRLGVSKLI